MGRGDGASGQNDVAAGADRHVRAADARAVLGDGGADGLVAGLFGFCVGGAFQRTQKNVLAGADGGCAPALERRSDEDDVVVRMHVQIAARVYPGAVVGGLLRVAGPVAEARFLGREIRFGCHGDVARGGQQGIPSGRGGTAAQENAPLPLGSIGSGHQAQVAAC